MGLWSPLGSQAPFPFSARLGLFQAVGLTEGCWPMLTRMPRCQRQEHKSGVPIQAIGAAECGVIGSSGSRVSEVRPRCFSACTSWVSALPPPDFTLGNIRAVCTLLPECGLYSLCFRFFLSPLCPLHLNLLVSHFRKGTGESLMLDDPSVIQPFPEATSGNTAPTPGFSCESVLLPPPPHRLQLWSVLLPLPHPDLSCESGPATPEFSCESMVLPTPRRQLCLWSSPAPRLRL